MKYFILFNIAFCFFPTRVLPQTKYNLSVESIVQKDNALIKIQSNRLYYPSGHKGQLLVYQMNAKGKRSLGYSTEAVTKLIYDEKNRKIVDTVTLKSADKKIFRINQQDDVVLFHGFYTIPSEFSSKLIDELDRGEFLLDYQDIWLELKSEVRKLKSYPDHYYDKIIGYSVENSGRYAIISTFVSQYLESTKADSIISIFPLLIDQIESAPKEISCIECIRPQIVGGYIYYGKKFFPSLGQDAYEWKIYRAPIFDLSKSELIGEYIELIYVSPDGKYILGKKYLYGKDTFVIIEINSKRFQYVLGRDYLNYKLFYSQFYKKFSFDTDKYFLYIEYPKEYPFKSVGSDAKRVRASNQESKVFWSKYIHTSLDRSK